MVSPARFTAWRAEVRAPTTVTVFPDGCVDILVISGQDGLQELVATELDAAPRRVQLGPGIAVVGLRLRPGISIDPRALSATPPDRIFAELEGLVRADPDSLHAVEALALGEAPASVAMGLGVSLRSLQRRLRGFGLPPPEFWRLLGRARAAAVALDAERPLAELAADLGYSDQAHLTRELVRWFGAPPRRLRAAPQQLAAIRQPGLGNWTTEQSSTR